MYLKYRLLNVYSVQFTLYIHNTLLPSMVNGKMEGFFGWMMEEKGRRGRERVKKRGKNTEKLEKDSTSL